MKNTLSKHNIGIFSYGRKQSQRCPNKMLRDFDQTTIADVLLEKLSDIDQNVFFAGHDPEFEKKCKEHGVEFVQRTHKSVTIDEPQTECLSFLRNVKYDYLLLINGCLPFLEKKTILGFLNNVVQGGLQPSAAVIRRNNYFFNSSKQALNFPESLKNLNTKTVEPIYEFANALYFFNREYFFKHGRYWDWSKLNLIELDSNIELIDIDTEEDFLMAEGLWKGLNATSNDIED